VIELLKIKATRVLAFILVITLVQGGVTANSQSSLEAYTNIQEIDNPEDYLALCTKNHRFPQDYEPSDLRKIKGIEFLLRDKAAEAFEQMRDAMDAVGLNIEVFSAYRSYNTQQLLFHERVRRHGSAERAEMGTARAGHSEHQSGLAVDIRHIGAISNMSFQYTAHYQWLLQHAHEYGYILRYPIEYIHITGYMFEPWHWRYIGIEHATAMKSGEYTVFEHYWEDNFIETYEIEMPTELTESDVLKHFIPLFFMQAIPVLGGK